MVVIPLTEGEAATVLPAGRRPFPPQNDHTTLAYDVERVLTDIDAEYGIRSLCSRRHGVLLFSDARLHRQRGRSTAEPFQEQTWIASVEVRVAQVLPRRLMTQ